MMTDLLNQMTAGSIETIECWRDVGLPLEDAIAKTFADSCAGPAVVRAVRRHYETWPFGILRSSDTDLAIREATEAERLESLTTLDGQIRVDGALCYVRAA